MADEERPARDSIDSLINRPLFEDDSGGKGFGPTLGSPAPDDAEAARPEPETWPSDVEADEPDLFPDAPEHRKHEHRLGSEIARAGEDLSPDVLRGAEPPEDDALPRPARIERSRPGVAAPDLPRARPERGR